jgi:hypothetical protein
MHLQLTDCDWQLQLISLYCWIDEGFEQRGWDSLCERFSPNSNPKFCDAEVLSVYLFARLRGHHTVKHARQFVQDFASNYFPRLPKYSAFVDRLNRLQHVLVQALQECTVFVGAESNLKCVIDSCPIVMASSKRSGRARVAPKLASPGRCATKSQYYYGVKLHVVGILRAGTIPFPVLVGVSAARLSDLKGLQACQDALAGQTLYADLAYKCKQTHKHLEGIGGCLVTGHKKNRWYHSCAGPCTASRTVSSRRQPIESLFAWLQEKTRFQNASRVRSEAGLLVFVWSALLIGALLLSTPD